MATDRLRKYIEHKGVSYYAFENSIGASRGSISKAVKENKSIGSSVLENILNTYTDLNPNWLLTGEGEMLKKAPSVDYGAIMNEADRKRVVSDRRYHTIHRHAIYSPDTLTIR